MTAQEKESPLHVTKIEPMSISFIKGRMSQKRLERFNFVWDLTFYPKRVSRNSSFTGSPEVHHFTPLDLSSDLDVFTLGSTFSRSHAELLVANGIANRASKGEVFNNVPFTVIEQKPTGMRQRFILWTKQANELLVKKGYVADVPLEHISRYLDASLTECASGRDFRTGFYQVEIPLDARKYFRFKTDDDHWYELSRLPMGHSCAPEIMHSLAATIAGHPDYVKSELAINDVRIDVWIDNIRYSGSRENTETRTKELDEVATKASATWKQADSFDLSASYDFLGVQFDHLRNSVVIADRLKKKIFGARLSKITASELESLMGRLMHASAVSGVSPGRFWFSLKFIRRIINKINRGIVSLDSLVSVPRSIQLELEKWINGASTERIINKKVSSKMRMLTVFVDASLEGWGGVIVEPSGELTVIEIQMFGRRKRVFI